MRIVVAGAALTLLAQCARPSSEDSASPPAMASAPRTEVAGSTKAPTRAPPESNTAAEVVDGSSKAAVDAASKTATKTAVDASVSRCLQPTPAAAPPPVAAGPAPGCPADPGGGRTLPTVRIVFPDAAGASVDAEVTSTVQDAQRGLMYRRSMAEDHGMLFDMGARGIYEFWMHDTCIPLDMVFADVDGFIVGIVENAPPLNDIPRGVACASRYVLELNAGWTRAHGVKAGQRMDIPPGT